MTTAALYTRVSPLDQNDTLQRTELRALCQRLSWSVIEYEEKGSMGGKRPVYDQLMADARKRKFDVVIVFTFDRWARSLKDLIKSIDTLHASRVRFICPRQGIDTYHNLTTQILGGLATFQHAVIVERVRNGIRKAQRAGKHCGRPKRIFSRPKALALQKQGFGLRAIGAKLGVSATTVSRGIRAYSAIG